MNFNSQTLRKENVNIGILQEIVLTQILFLMNDSIKLVEFDQNYHDSTNIALKLAEICKKFDFIKQLFCFLPLSTIFNFYFPLVQVSY